MNNVIRNVLVIAVGVAACVLVAVLLYDRPESGAEQTVAEPARPKFTLDDGSSWPMFRGRQSLSGMASGTLPEQLEVVWKFQTNDSIKSSPAIVDGLVFIGSSDENIYAIDLETG